MKRTLFILAAGTLMLASPVLAKTPDGKPPSEETVCDGLTGAASGLCNAYCEAMDCDSPNHHASDNACAQVKRNFERKTGQPLPCEVVCPCGQLLPLFAALANGTATAEQCLTSSDALSIVTPEGSFAIVVGDSTPPFCSVNLEPPFVELTQAEVVACRDLLRRIAASQSVTCVPFE